MSSAEDFFEVERVLDKRISRGVVQYKIQWKGEPKSQAKWVSESDCRCQILIDEFEKA